jgi:hypothetical protein
LIQVLTFNIIFFLFPLFNLKKTPNSYCAGAKVL